MGSYGAGRAAARREADRVSLREIQAWQRGYLAGRLAGLTQAAACVCPECALRIGKERRTVATPASEETRSS